MKLAERTDALLASVERYRSEHCAALREPAAAEARTLLKAALADARRRVTTAIVEERRRLGHDVGAVEAGLATERRLVAQQRAVQLLDRAWTALRAALTQRWQHTAQRRQWVDTHLARARECLAHDADWTIAYHDAWTAAERARSSTALQADSIRAAFEHDAALGGGFVVTCGHNVLDASLDGLLADRAAIEGRLLQQLAEDSA